MEKSLLEKIAVMQAYADGKVIQMHLGGDNWSDIFDPAWNWVKCDYRIKPEPQEPIYRHYKSAEEVLEDMKVHGPMVKKDGKYFAITEIDCEFIWPNTRIGGGYIGMFKQFTWQDGTPFGKKEDEV